MKTVAEKKWVPLFPGTGPKSTIGAQRKYCATELGAGAKRLAEVEKKLAEAQKEMADIDKQYAHFEEAYHNLRSATTLIVSLEEFQYVRLQYRDFAEKRSQLQTAMEVAQIEAKAVRAHVENMRQNVIYLDRILAKEAEVVFLHGSRGQGH